MKNCSKLVTGTAVAVFMLVSSMAGSAMANGIAICSQSKNISGDNFNCTGSATDSFSCVLKQGEPANQCYWKCTGASTKTWVYNSEKSTGTGKNNQSECNKAVGGAT